MMTLTEQLTEKEKFLNYLKSEGYTTSTVFNFINLTPHHRKDKSGNHNIISSICCCIFQGSNSKEGDLGCITFYYGELLNGNIIKLLPLSNC